MAASVHCGVWSLPAVRLVAGVVSAWVLFAFLLFCPHGCNRPAMAQDFKATGPTLDGERLNEELPTDRHLKNRGGSDGLGLCVFASIAHAGDWHNEPVAKAMFNFMFTRPGGGYPSKVDQIFKLCAQSKGQPVPDYLQHTGGDMEFLKLALKTGRYPSVTYAGQDGVYYGGPIDHMVNLVYLSDRYAVIHDNNYPGKWLWMPPKEFEKRWKARGGGWAVVLLSPGKPPALSANDLAANPKYCVCEEGQCKCANCPNTCVALVGQCANGVCTVPSLSASQPAYEWKQDAADPGYFYLYKDGKQVGTMYPDERGYRTWTAERGWFNVPAPIPLPVQNFGIVTDKMPMVGQARYYRNGEECGKQRAFASLVENSVPDDSKLSRIVVVAGPAERERIKAAWAAGKFMKHQSNYILQTFDPSDWQVAGYPRGVTIIKPGPSPSGKGEVVKQGTEYLDPDLLLLLLDQLLNPPSKPNPSLPALPASVPSWWLLVAVVVLYLFGKKKPDAPK